MQWLLDRPKTMKAAMLKPPGEPNVVFDTSVLPKLTGAAGAKRMAGERGVGGGGNIGAAAGMVAKRSAAVPLPNGQPAPLSFVAAGVVHEVTLSRVGNLTCPVAGELALVTCHAVGCSRSAAHVPAGVVRRSCPFNVVCTPYPLTRSQLARCWWAQSTTASCRAGRRQMCLRCCAKQRWTRQQRRSAGCWRQAKSA